MNEIWGHYAKWVKIVTRRQLLPDFTYDIIIETESRQVCVCEEWWIRRWHLIDRDSLLMDNKCLVSQQSGNTEQF